MRALVIAPQPFFSPRGTPFSVYYRTLITAELGVTVDLLTYGSGQDVDIPGVRIIRIPRFPFFGEVKIGPSGLKLFLDIFLIIWTVFLLLRNHYDFVHAHEEAVFFCRFLKPLFRFKLIYDMHSSLPQQLTNFQYTSSKLLINLFAILENSCLKNADAIITICPDLANYVTSLIGTKKHFLIENSIFDQVKIRLRLSNPKSNSNEKERESDNSGLLNNKRLILYAGTLEPYQGIDLLIKAFRNVITNVPDSFLIIIGGTKAQVEKYLMLVDSYRLKPYCLFTGRVPQSHAKKFAKQAAVLVSPRIEGTNTPLKIYEQLASAIPLVATKIHSHTQVLDDNVSFMVEPTPEALSQGIVSALNSAPERKRRVSNAKKLYEQKYSRAIYVKKMKQLLELVS
jgi:glycosyltransferase involved in cell wall biosynthesis